jgi:hypothetical protein
MSIPAFANNTTPQPPQPQQQQQQQKMTTKQLNQQALKNSNKNLNENDNLNKNTNGDNDINNDISSGNGDFNAFSFAYQEAPLIIPQAVVGPTSTVISKGVKVGPLFGYSWQEENATPEGARQWRDLAIKAYTNSGSKESEVEQSINLAVLCAVQEKGGLDIPNQMNTECR